MLNSITNENLSEALRYASLGYKVYPVWGIKDGKCLCGGMEDCRPGKHPYGKAVPHGEKDATTDAEKIRRWFKGASVNVGISIDGFCVLDADCHSIKANGLKTLVAWKQQYGSLPLTPTVASGGGGRHFYFKPLPLTLKQKVEIGIGVELLTSGCVIAPPSRHEKDNRYEWLVPLEMPLAEMPKWLVEIVKVGSKAPVSGTLRVPETGSVQKADSVQKASSVSPHIFNPMEGFVDDVLTFANLGLLPAGSRNTSVNSAIGSMLASGFAIEQITEEGLRWAEKQEPPYSPSELEEKIRFFAKKHEVEIAELAYSQNAPLHQGEACSPSSPFASSPPSSDNPQNHPNPIEPLSELYYGLLGEFVQAVEPFTEADPIGILACLLAGVGNALGRSIHHRIGTRHAGNLFVLLVGATSSRKGTCWSVARTLLRQAASDWASDCVENGFGSGQGFVWRIRDAQGDDTGMPDKRLLVVEPEWAKPMRLMRSETSTLSPTIRNAYDGEPLGDLNKGENRQRCQEPHLSIIGMITPDELKECLKDRSYLHNGFLNRFLLIDVKRTRYLPSGADYLSVCSKFAGSLREAFQRASALQAPFGIAAEAEGFWDAEYRRLEQERQGIYGKATARLSVHALKVAMLYAALDGENAIGLRHLRSALAFIAHADRTALDLFGTGSPVAVGEEPSHDKLLRYARTQKNGITKTDAYRLFSNKRKADGINADFAWLTPLFGDWRNDRWFAKEFLEESVMGCGVVCPSEEQPCESANGESANGTEAPGAKEGL